MSELDPPKLSDVLGEPFTLEYMEHDSGLTLAKIALDTCRKGARPKGKNNENVRVRVHEWSPWTHSAVERLPNGTRLTLGSNNLDEDSKLSVSFSDRLTDPAEGPRRRELVVTDTEGREIILPLIDGKHPRATRELFAGVAKRFYEVAHDRATSTNQE